MALPDEVDVKITVGNADLTSSIVWSQTTFQTVAGATPGTCNIVVRGPNPPPGVGSLIKLTLDGVLNWQGYLFTRQSGYTFSDDPDDLQWTLSGVDLNILFDKLILYNHDHPTRSLDGGGTYKRVKVTGGHIVTVPRHTYDREYIIAMMADTDIDLVTPTIHFKALVEQIGQINPDGAFTPPTPGLTLRAFMQDVSANVQRSTPGSTIWYINPAGYLVYKEQDTDIAPFSVGDTDPGTSVMVKNLSMSTDISRIKNDVLIFTGNLNPDPASTQSRLLYRHKINSGSVTNYGRFQYSEQLSSSWLQGSINARANKIIAQEGTPAGRAEFVTFKPGLFPGQLVNIFSDAHDFADNYPIRSIDITFLNPTMVRYRVQCSFDTQDPWGLILALKRPPVRGLTQPPYTVIDLTAHDTIEHAEVYTKVREWPKALSGNHWQCSYAYIRFSMTVIVNGRRQVSVPEEGTTVGFKETSPDDGVFFMDASGKPYVEYHVWHDLDTQ